MRNPDRTEVSDEALMSEFVKTLENDAFDTLMMRHYSGACAFARNRLQDKESADDAVQEAFISVVRNRERYDAARSFSSWFYAILRNVCIDLYRKRTRYDDKICNLTQAVQSRVESRSCDCAGELLEFLSAEDREMMVLRLVEGLSFAEIAELYGCSIDAAKKRCQRTLKRLRACPKNRET